MRRGSCIRFVMAASVLGMLATMGSALAKETLAPPTAPLPATVTLPKPRLDGTMTLERALAERRSIRALADAPIPLDSLSRLLWAAQGVTDDRGHRTSPSARTTYPLDVLAIVGNVDGIAPGIYRYDPASHALALQSPGDRRKAFVQEAIGQDWIPSAAVIFVITGTPARASAKMGARSGQFTGLEAGLAAQSLLLEVTSLGLGSTFVGGFDGEKAARFLNLSAGETAHGVLPVGVRK